MGGDVGSAHGIRDIGSGYNVAEDPTASALALTALSVVTGLEGHVSFSASAPEGNVTYKTRVHSRGTTCTPLLLSEQSFLCLLCRLEILLVVVLCDAPL
jgi:hypothetical protein